MNPDANQENKHESSVKCPEVAVSQKKVKTKSWQLFPGMVLRLSPVMHQQLLKLRLQRKCSSQSGLLQTMTSHQGKALELQRALLHLHVTTRTGTSSLIWLLATHNSNYLSSGTDFLTAILESEFVPPKDGVLSVTIKENFKGKLSEPQWHLCPQDMPVDN